MNRIIKIGMDVHSTNYTLCAMEPTIGSEDRIFGEVQVDPDYKARTARHRTKGGSLLLLLDPQGAHFFTHRQYEEI